MLLRHATDAPKLEADPESKMGRKLPEWLSVLIDKQQAAVATEAKETVPTVAKVPADAVKSEGVFDRYVCIDLCTFPFITFTSWPLLILMSTNYDRFGPECTCSRRRAFPRVEAESGRAVGVPQWLHDRPGVVQRGRAGGDRCGEYFFAIVPSKQYSIGG